jgi:hypothetical protein
MSEQPPQYQIGQIVNGHRWTGTTWEPVTAPGPEMAGPAMQPMGTPPKKSWYKKWWGIGLIGFGALVLLVAIFGGGEDTTATDEPATTPTAEATEAPADEPATDEAESEEEPTEEAAPAAGVGDPVRDGKFEFTVTDVETGVGEVGNEFLSSEAQGEYTLISMKIENIGDEAQTFFSDNVTGIDSEARELSSDSEATLYANENNSGWIDEINPGNSIEVIVAFDVAKGATLEAIKVQDSAFSGGAEISLQ